MNKKKIDRRIDYKIVIDTETTIIDKTRSISGWNSFVYDCGWAVVDKRGKIYKVRSFVNADIFLREQGLMQSAYYAQKIPLYVADIKNGKRILTSFYNIRKAFLKDCEEYNCTKIFAHNMHFDYGSLNNTQRWLTKSKYRYFFPYGVEICDTLKMAKDVIATKPTYKKFCEKNGYLTKFGKPRLTAEIIYQYITGDTNFIESHTGLEDVLIEKEIMAYCYRQHKKMRRLCFEN